MDYETEAHASRARHQAAIRAAGQAQAAGKKSPPIPTSITEEAEAVEVQILSHVVPARKAETAAAAANVTRLVVKHAGSFVDPVAAGFPDAVAERTRPYPRPSPRLRRWSGSPAR